MINENRKSRIVGWLLCGLAVAALVGAIAFYIVVTALECAFQINDGSCGAKSIFELGFQQIIFLLVIPGAIVISLALGGITMLRKGRGE